MGAESDLFHLGVIQFHRSRPAEDRDRHLEPCPLFVQEPELMHSYVEAFAKVLDNLDALLELPFEPVPIRY